MATVVLDAYSKAYPTIVNRIRASVFENSDPAALIATIIDTTAGHPQRIWHFPGLPRRNYGFSLDEIDAGGNPINNLALFDVVPSALSGYLERDDEQIKVDVTPGFVAGANQAWFDGRETAPGSGIFHPDYIGWEIVPSELTGRGILAKGLDYSWDKTTGEFLLLQGGDQFYSQGYWNIHFNPQVAGAGAGGSVPTINDFSARIVTANETLVITDFGNTVIVEPAGVYTELTLPDIATVPIGRLLCIEVTKFRGANVQTVKIAPHAGDTISFMRGSIWMMNNENLKIWRFRRPDNSNEWRVRDEHGNFHQIGELISDDAISSGVYCKQLLDGSIKNRYQYARIYEEVVLTLPAAQVVNYDDWATGNNKYLYSKANSADPGNADKFHFPDRRGIFERNNNAGKAGDYGVDTVGPHTHLISPPSSNSANGYGKTATGSDALGGDGPVTPYASGDNNVGGETVPKHYLTNKYVRI